LCRLDDVEDAPFVILACDGVWDVISDDDAVHLVLDLQARQVRRACVYRM
jgi:serine/threonine protein phosphatase PrpC